MNSRRFMAQDYHGHCKFLHSHRTASIGSIDAARRAGATQAATATASSSAVTPLRISGSRELSRIQRDATVLHASDSATPATTPAPTFHDVVENTMPTTSRALAPRA